VRFGADGYLYVSGGDGATSEQAPTTTESGDAANTSMRGGAVTMQAA
jgi:hypothetical protein